MDRNTDDGNMSDDDNMSDDGNMSDDDNTSDDGNMSKDVTSPVADNRDNGGDIFHTGQESLSQVSPLHDDNTVPDSGHDDDSNNGGSDSEYDSGSNDSELDGDEDESGFEF